jgi:hypothetical protein
VFKNMVDCWSCDPGGRKVSTEGKAASGTTPDSGSIPGYSTSEELSVMAEDLADLRDELKKMQEQFKELKSTVVALQMIPSIPMTGGGRGGAADWARGGVITSSSSGGAGGSGAAYYTKDGRTYKL